jgi:hypothetical protein
MLGRAWMPATSWRPWNLVAPASRRRGELVGETASAAERRATLLDRADPFLRVQPEVTVGDHAGGLLERELGLLDQVRGLASGSAYLRAARVQGCGAGRVLVGEPLPSTDELHPAGLPRAGVGGVLEERGECLGKLGYAIERVNG